MCNLFNLDYIWNAINDYQVNCIKTIRQVLIVYFVNIINVVSTRIAICVSVSLIIFFLLFLRDIPSLCKLPISTGTYKLIFNNFDMIIINI